MIDRGATTQCHQRIRPVPRRVPTRLAATSAMPEKHPATHHQVAVRTGPPKESKTLTASQSTSRPTRPPTMTAAAAISGQYRVGGRKRRYPKNSAVAVYTVTAIGDPPRMSLARRASITYWLFLVSVG